MESPFYLYNESFTDPADVLQKDSPYYEIEPVSKNGKKGSDYEKTHSLVKKHHITQIEKEGNIYKKSIKYLDYFISLGARTIHTEGRNEIIRVKI